MNKLVNIELRYHNMQQAELCTVPHIPMHGLKPFWNDHLSDLKDKSIFGATCGGTQGNPSLVIFFV